MPLKSKHIEEIIQIARSYDVRRLILFGSAADTPENANDVDLACDGVNDWKFYEFGAAIEDRLNLPVDLISLTPTTRFTRYVEAKGKVLI